MSHVSLGRILIEEVWEPQKLGQTDKTFGYDIINMQM